MVRQRPSAARRGIEIADASHGERVAERLVEVERDDEDRRGRAHERVEQRGRILGRGREPLEPARARPDRHARAEPRGGGLAHRHGSLLLGGDDVEERRPRRPELRDLLGDGAHALASTSAVARNASSNEVTPAAILRTA